MRSREPRSSSSTRRLRNRPLASAVLRLIDLSAFEPVTGAHHRPPDQLQPSTDRGAAPHPFPHPREVTQQVRPASARSSLVQENERMI